ncbi:MAG: hypothetical protein AAGI28_14055 [Pseudomonadota bacterium]
MTEDTKTSESVAKTEMPEPPAKRPWETPTLTRLGKDLSDVGGARGPFTESSGTGRDNINRFS